MLGRGRQHIHLYKVSAKQCCKPTTCAVINSRQGFPHCHHSYYNSARHKLFTMSFYWLALQTYYERLQAEAEHHSNPQHRMDGNRAVQQCMEPEQVPSDNTACVSKSQPSISDASSPGNMGPAGKVMILTCTQLTSLLPSILRTHHLVSLSFIEFNLWSLTQVSRSHVLQMCCQPC